jgi:hypothetical protein
MELDSQDIEQASAGPAGIAALVLEVFDLLDGYTKPLSKSSLSHTGVLAQSQYPGGAPFHHYA